MSTRAQALIQETGVYLYQHSDGYDLGDEVRAAIATPRGMARRNDAEYLTRVIFEEMLTQNNAIGKEYGFGIGTQRADDIEYFVTVSLRAQTVTVESLRGVTPPEVWTFDGQLVTQ